ncbi:MAG: replicative DNA helicase [Deltaproteobacteria bacterium]|nr:replicative DNA helicase [Deltaproteobacteria bacterium]
MADNTGKDYAIKVPPHSIEAEKAVLGGILLEQDAVNRVLEFLSPDGSDFYHPAHTRIFRAISGLSERAIPVDMITLNDALKDADALSSVGGASYLGVLVDFTGTAANVTFYAKIVRAKAMLRKIILTANDISTRAFEGREETDEFVDEVEKLIFQITQDRSRRSYWALKDLIKPAFENIENLFARKTHITGISTGYQDLDRLTSGLQNSDLIIIAGRPGMGKTSFALNIAENVAIDSGEAVAVFSLEMSKEQLTQRMLASRAKVGLQGIRNGFLRSDDWGRLSNAAGTLSESKIYIDDTAAQTVLEMRAKARRWKKDLGIRLVIVDYLQLMRGTGHKDNREQEISAISRSLKAMAKELDMPVIALSQLSRMTEQRGGDKKPQLSDLRESGAIEQDADMVMFVYRKSAYEDCPCPKELCTCGVRRTAELLIRKQRNGPTGDIKLTFLHEYTRFEDQTTDYEVKTEWVE